MKTKFSKKLLALFLAVVMALTAFSGTLSAFAATADPDYHDDNITANPLGWIELQDEQTCAAVLDYIDQMLAGMDQEIVIYFNATVLVINIQGRLDSVSGLLDIVDQFDQLIDDNGSVLGMAGDLGSVDLSALGDLPYNSNYNESQCGKAYRERNSAKEILTALFKTLYGLAGPGSSDPILKKFVAGTLDLGIVGSFLDVYSTLNNELFAGMLNGPLKDGYQNDLVYNIVVRLLTDLTDWYTEDEKTNMINGVDGYELDTMLFKALQDNLLKQINVTVTYPDGTNSVERYKQGQKDPNLMYTPDGNVYLFQYDADGDGVDDAQLSLTKDTTLASFAYDAFSLAWKTVLAPTLGLVNSAVKDYDWNYTQWYLGKGYKWNYSDVASNYEASKVEAWASEEGVELEAVKADLTYDRSIVDNANYNWSDLDTTKLFNELRRSPLMVYYFKAETGPLNTNLQCTGTPNISAFMENNYNQYGSMLAGLNDFLIAAVKDFLPEYDASQLKTINTTDEATVASTLVANALKVVQYVMDETDENILSSFYHTYGDGAFLTETNFEEAMVPFLIACLENNIGGIISRIHKDKWDACKDAEGVAVVVLEEYLSFILPNRDYSSLITKDSDGYYNVTLEGAIIPMARDAIGYVMMQFVPVEDGNGDPWVIYDEGDTVTTYEQQIENGTDIFTLLNSVVVYYANDTGIGNLLGLTDQNGTCTITHSNTIWQNIDLVANALLPVLGELQYGDAGKRGQFDSYDLIWNDIVSGVLNIGDSSNHTETNAGGITNFIYRFATIINAPAISETGVDATAYGFVRDLLNGLLGGRYSGQVETIVPEISALSDPANPFDSVIRRDIIAGVPGNASDLGLLRALSNLIEFTGTTGQPDTFWDGAMYIVQGVNSFINFLPQIGNYQAGRAGVSLSQDSITSYTAGQPISGNVIVDNTSIGINRYVANADKTSTQLSRTYLKVESITSDVSGVTVAVRQDLIAPEQKAEFEISGSLSEGDLGSEMEKLVTYTVVYDIVDKDGAVLYDDISTDVYQYVSAQADWRALTYSSATESGFTESFVPASGMQQGKYSSMSGELWNSWWMFKYNYCGIQFPNTTIIKTSELDKLDETTLFFYNDSSTSKSVDGIVAYDNNYGGSNYFAVTCDPVTGAITNTNFYDYYQYDYTTKMVEGPDGEMVEVREFVYDEHGNKTGKWITDDPKTRTDVLNLVEQDEFVADYRFHQIATLDELRSGAKFTSDFIEKKGEDGNYEAIYLRRTGDDTTGYKTWFDYSKTDANDVSLSTGIPGITLSFEKLSNVAANYKSKYPFLTWDQETDVKADDVTINFTIVCDNSKDFSMRLMVCDDSEAAEITETVDNGMYIIDNYEPSHFTDYDGESSKIYDYFKQTLKDALEAKSIPVDTGNATELGSNKAYFAVETSTTDMVGDIAYKPATQELINSEAFASLKADVYLNEGVYYQTFYTDKDGVMHFENPVYGNVELTDDDVTNKSTIMIGEESYDCGEDALGNKVVKIRLNGVDTEEHWRLLNDTQYVQEWVDLGVSDGNLYSEPFLQTTEVQDTDAEGNKLYKATSFVYRDAYGIKCTSKDQWVVKIAETEYTIVPNDPDARGYFAVANDKLQYAHELAFDSINVTDGEQIYDNVLTLRSGLNNVNFNVITYEAMADYGREAESLISVDYYNDYFLSADDEAPLFSCYASEAEEKLEAYNSSNDTAYALSSLVVVTDEETRPQISSTATPFQIAEAQRLFNIYLANVVERGYIGDKLEEEISCAVNGKSCEGKDDKTTPYTSVTVNVAEASYSVDGQTYTADNNKDGVTYTAESWATFINALDAAVKAANASETYLHAQEGPYVATDKDNYTLQVSNVDSLRGDLMHAENGLTEAGEVAPEGYTVTAYIGALSAPEAEYGSYATTGATVTITTDAGEISAVTDETGKFVLENVPNGEYTATVTYKYGFDRTFKIIVNGADVTSETMVGIVGCNWDGNSAINANDYSVYMQYVGAESTSEDYDTGIDIDRNNAINANDGSVYVGFVGSESSNYVYHDTVIQ